MAYTQEDLQSVEDAIAKLQNGERVVQVAHDSHMVKYAEVDLAELIRLRNQIKSIIKVGNHKRKIQILSNKGVF